MLGGLLRDIRIEDQQRQRREQLRLAMRHLPRRIVAPMGIDMPGAGRTPPKTICTQHAARSTQHARSQLVRDYFVWVV